MVTPTQGHVVCGSAGDWPARSMIAPRAYRRDSQEIAAATNPSRSTPGATRPGHAIESVPTPVRSQYQIGGPNCIARRAAGCAKSPVPLSRQTTTSAAPLTWSPDSIRRIPGRVSRLRTDRVAS